MSDSNSQRSNQRIRLPGILADPSKLARARRFLPQRRDNGLSEANPALSLEVHPRFVAVLLNRAESLRRRHR